MHDNQRSVDVNVAGPSMLANLMTAAVAYAVQRGVSLEHIAEAAELEPADLIATSERVPDDAVSRILGLLHRRFPGEPVALEMAATAPVSFLGPLAPVARLVPDLRSGIEMFVQYRSVLSTSVVLELIDEPPGPMLRFEHPNDLEFGPQGAEMALMMGARSVAEVFGIPDAVRLVWVGHGPTGPEQRYEAAFAAPVRFDAPFDALLFHAHRLDEPVDPEGGARLRILLSYLELARQELEQEEEPAELRLIRDAIARNAAGGEYGAAALASRLGISLRTLQRRVADLDTSVRELIDEVRAATARQLLADPQLNLLEISVALGYSTEGAFRRAFRRWTGTSPTDYRGSPT
ncbi:MAG: AraC family transcriptional regulator ligand-binding domain-containing protein [Actinomycetota bacterium]